MYILYNLVRTAAAVDTTWCYCTYARTCCTAAAATVSTNEYYCCCCVRAVRADYYLLPLLAFVCLTGTPKSRMRDGMMIRHACMHPHADRGWVYGWWIPILFDTDSTYIMYNMCLGCLLRWLGTKGGRGTGGGLRLLAQIFKIKSLGRSRP